jgi:predicted DNA-binding ribbon-helix-helix protein
MSGLRKRSIHLHGQKTSVSLEEEFWDAFRQIAAARGVRLADLINTIAGERPQGANLSSAIRLFVLRHFQASRSGA